MGHGKKPNRSRSPQNTKTRPKDESKASEIPRGKKKKIEPINLLPEELISLTEDDDTTTSLPEMTQRAY